MIPHLFLPIYRAVQLRSTGGGHLIHAMTTVTQVRIEVGAGKFVFSFEIHHNCDQHNNICTKYMIMFHGNS